MVLSKEASVKDMVHQYLPAVTKDATTTLRWEGYVEGMAQNPILAKCAATQDATHIW